MPGTVFRALFLLFPIAAILSMAAPADEAEAPAAETDACFIPGRGDFAWENDRVAFRAYGPPLRKQPEDSGIDCWLKRVDYPIVKKWYAEAKKGKSYHKDHGEGYDPYHVGSSRGCGGLGLWENGQLVLSDVFTQWKILIAEPNRQVFQLFYTYPKADGDIEEVKTITIEPGSQLCRVEAEFTRGGKSLADLDLAIGITTHNQKATAVLNPAGGWMACWEAINGVGLGTGVVVEPSRVVKMEELKTTAKDGSHALCHVRTDASGRISYQTGFAWAGAGRIARLDEWERYLSTAAGGKTVPSTSPAERLSVNTQEGIVNIMTQVADFQIREYGDKVPVNWKSGTFFGGLAALYEISGEKSYLQYATRWAERAGWKVSKHGLHADGICAAQTYLELYSLQRDASRIADVQAKIESYFDRTNIQREELVNPRWKEASQPFEGRHLWWWCDALYMAPPVLARLGVLTGESRYGELLHKLYWDSVEFLYDRETHLFFRDAAQFPDKRTSPSGQKIFWGRGNGWVFAGLVRILEYLPEDDAQRPRYIALFQELAASLLACQQSDGLWRSSLKEPAWFPEPEASASSLICYGFAAGINRGWLDRTVYLPATEKAWRGLCGLVSPEGKLGHAQLVAAAPGPVQAGDSADYANGGFLLAGSEMYRLAGSSTSIMSSMSKTTTP